MVFYKYKIKRGNYMNMNYKWRLLILDKTNIYTQIYDEVYGNSFEVLEELKQKYSDKSKYICLLIEG